MLKLKNISFEVEGKKILDNINLELEDNKYYVITGPNGSGKSFLMKVIMGIEKPSSGKIFFNGEDITEYKINERANLGMSFAFQQPIKFKGLTVFDLLKLSSGHKIDFNTACNVLSEVGLCAKEYINREINSSLSGGELKRIEIASIILRNSKLTIFDEPEAGIDIWSFSRLINVFTKLNAEVKNTILIISHQERILNIADKIILLENGKIKLFDDKNKVLHKIGVTKEPGCACLYKKENENGSN